MANRRHVAGGEPACYSCPEPWEPLGRGVEGLTEPAAPLLANSAARAACCSLIRLASNLDRLKSKPAAWQTPRRRPHGPRPRRRWPALWLRLPASFMTSLANWLQTQHLCHPQHGLRQDPRHPREHPAAAAAVLAVLAATPAAALQRWHASFSSASSRSSSCTPELMSRWTHPLHRQAAALSGHPAAAALGLAGQSCRSSRQLWSRSSRARALTSSRWAASLRMSQLLLQCLPPTAANLQLSLGWHLMPPSPCPCCRMPHHVPLRAVAALAGTRPHTCCGRTGGAPSAAAPARS